ncbi:DNA-binding transcriptional regulator, FadR family [Mesorhizobium albiziae]|uniref:DNA-binding transcriptional regulator, FadR family n=1 Tax=Neomesorhizobium albiziae TaxID=335020 RepID=A0A1I4EWP3_9HYPH|nr:FadR/GntR family transcriptional regulator [Mesorhizobium albiziae]GLS32659.1 GntR family transcriptional regulator [Mesorhizobium albiziae]SFL08947.1 DNA-binding transcriptional regulator, FadR family [Mesorhizobium albiziae]
MAALVEVEGTALKLPRPRVLPNVVRAIASDVLSRRYPPGAMLPRESDLGTEYGVSRTVIREALKVLAAKGLVLSRPRVGTIVCDRNKWSIIDPQVLAWYTPDTIDPQLLDAILETRRAIEPLVVELAATRATLREIADLETAWKGMAAAGATVELFVRSDTAFHQLLYGACHNPIFRQIGGLIETALNFTQEATANSVDRRDEAVKAHFGIIEALRMRDGAAAREATNKILDMAARDLERAKIHKTGLNGHMNLGARP